MVRSRYLLLSISILFTLFRATPLSAKQAPPPDHWVGTWSASPMTIDNKNAFGSHDMTLREVVHVSLGGPLIRVVLTNEFGIEPLTVGAAHVAVTTNGNGINLASANALSFGGRSSITIPPGAMVVSDPVALALKPLSDLTISLDVPAQTITRVSGHAFANQTSFVADGNQVSKSTLSDATEITSWPFLKGVDTRVSGFGSTIVCFGDSITDGARSTQNANARWPDVLARRLEHDRHTDNLGVLNQGIGGNRVLGEGAGPAALARFDRDVLAQAGVRYVIFMEGINDIGSTFDPRRTSSAGSGQPPLTADDLIVAYKQMIERAHTHGIRVIGATLTPYGGAGYASPQGEAVRKAVNEWIRTSKDLDGFVDFEKVTRNSSNSDVFADFADSGDHLHPKDAGYTAMGVAIDLKSFIPDKKQQPVKSKLAMPH